MDPKTVRRYVAARDAGEPVTGTSRRDRITDPFLPKVEESVEASREKICRDKVHERIVALGFDGDERTTRRAVAECKRVWRAGHRRTYRPRVAEAGRSGPSTREQQLEAEAADLIHALSEAAVELRAWKKTAEGRLGTSRTGITTARVCRLIDVPERTWRR